MTQAAALRSAPRQLERRRHRRVPVALLGRYMLESREEYPCQTIDVSPGGAMLTAPVSAAVGERVVLYLEHLGRLEGQIARLNQRGFAIAFAATPRKRDKLASQLTWLVNRQALGLPEDRRHERIVPRQLATVLKVDGREIPARLIDVSLSGAALAAATKPAIGASVVVGRTPARVVRHFEGGMAVEFALPISPDRFDEGIIL